MPNLHNLPTCSVPKLKFVLHVVWLAALSGCAPYYKIKQFYSGEQRPAQEIAILQIDPHVIVSRVNEVSRPNEMSKEFIAGSAQTSRQALALLPGQYSMDVQFHALCLYSDGKIKLEFSVNPGKVYRLKSELVDATYWKPSVVPYEGEEVPGNFWLYSALCPIKVNVILLPASR